MLLFGRICTIVQFWTILLYLPGISTLVWWVWQNVSPHLTQTLGRMQVLLSVHLGTNCRQQLLVVECHPILSCWPCSLRCTLAEIYEILLCIHLPVACTLGSRFSFPLLVAWPPPQRGSSLTLYHYLTGSFCCSQKWRQHGWGIYPQFPQLIWSSMGYRKHNWSAYRLLWGHTHDHWRFRRIFLPDPWRWIPWAYIWVGNCPWCILICPLFAWCISGSVCSAWGHLSSFLFSSTTIWGLHRSFWTHCGQCGHELGGGLCWSNCWEVPLVWTPVNCPKSFTIAGHHLGLWNIHCLLSVLVLCGGKVGKVFCHNLVVLVVCHWVRVLSM